MGLQLIIFCLLFLVCPYANGARDIGTENLEISSEPYVTNYGARKIVKELEVSEPYMTNYGGRKIGKEVEISEPYLTNYGARKSEETVEVKEPYMTNYGARESVREVEARDPYMTNYGARKSVEEMEVREPYMTNYGARERVKEVEVIEPYMINYGATESGHEAEEPYVTNYGAKKSVKEVKIREPYTTNYGAKKSGKEVREPYMTNYGATESEQVEKPYMTNYGSKEDIKETEASYITQYGTKKQEEASYITQYGTKQEEASYITQYGTKQGETRVERTVPSAHEHHHHMHAHSSSRDEAHEQGFFTLVDFHKGCTMPLNFPNQNHSPFLPRETADSLPFSTSQLPQLLQLFSIPRDSREARHMAYTLDQCEQTPIKGETKFCATSLESMNDFVHKIIGSGIKLSILSTTHPSTSTSITQKYTILKKPKRVIASKMVFCHPVPYPYAVFFCHHFETDTRFFQVSLGGENGDTVEAVAVCHMDTSDWDSNLSLFRDLGIKAGASSPVCHFLPENHLAWIPSPVTATA
ncbi:BURP domain-containing protein 11-like [Argentina anserina]|uniref:BURP domain-containing protein 11-like n=1 Tax=Argentina anserina TaxID=57926 RepID=UPI0021768EB1|nr:BURP domain-containing protein 11-like [Potentilla anserina]